MAVVDEFVEADVGLHYEGVPHFGRDGSRGDVENAGGIRRTRSRRVAGLRDAEEHDPAEAEPGGLARSGTQAVDRVLHYAGHRGDGRRLAKAFAHEHRQDELRGEQMRLREQATEGRILSQPTHTDRGEGFAHWVVTLLSRVRRGA